MGDYWNDSGFYEQREIRRANELAERDQAMQDMWTARDRMMERSREEEYVANANRRRDVGYSGSSGSGSISYAIGFAIGRLFAQPLVQVGTLPALLSRGIFLMVPLSIAAIYFFRSVPHWMLLVLVSLLLAFSSPLLVKIIRTAMVIVLIIAALLIGVGIAGTVFHWWHFTSVSPVPAQHVPTPNH